MAGFVAVANNNVYHSFINAETEGIENGVFVTPDYKEGTVKLATDDTDAYFVSVDIDTLPEDLVDTVDFKTKVGRPLRAKKISVGEVVVTTSVNGEIADFADGVAVTVGADGKATVGEGAYVVKGTTTAYGTEAVKLQLVK